MKISAFFSQFPSVNGCEKSLKVANPSGNRKKDMLKFLTHKLKTQSINEEVHNQKVRMGAFVFILVCKFIVTSLKVTESVEKMAAVGRNS